MEGEGNMKYWRIEKYIIDKGMSLRGFAAECGILSCVVS
jgi:hypothetical protein